MKNKLFVMGVLAIMLVFGIAIVGCDDGSTDGNASERDLIGKWEFEKIIEGGIQYDLPYEGTNSGGYEFTSNSVKIYENGSIVQNYIISIQNNTIYLSGREGYIATYSINGNKMTFMMTSTYGGILRKVSKFSWE